MSNGRGDKRKRRAADRDGDRFIALPTCVLDSAAYLALSHAAKALLIEVARQFHGDDNGRMLLSGKHLASRGWNSPEVIVRAKRALLEAGFIFETVKGHRPNKASWYAVTWLALSKLDGYDVGAEKAFERSAYRRQPVIAPRQKIAPLSTGGVVAGSVTATSDVVTPSLTTTETVAIEPVVGESPATAAVHPLEMPSAVTRNSCQRVSETCAVPLRHDRVAFDVKRRIPRTKPQQRFIRRSVGADLNLTHRADPILTRGWMPTV